MRRAFTRWLSGDPPAIAGAWLDQSGVCLVVMDWSDASPRLAQVIYEPGGQFAVRVNDEAGFNSAEVTNALRCAYEKLGSGSYALALGIPSADIFIKTIEIPTGLDDQQIAQLSVVEAVSNLPVPPEEVCSDFLRRSLDTTQSWRSLFGMRHPMESSSCTTSTKRLWRPLEQLQTDCLSAGLRWSRCPSCLETHNCLQITSTLHRVFGVSFPTGSLCETARGCSGGRTRLSCHGVTAFT